MLSQAQGRKRSRRPPARPRGEQRCTEQGDTIPLRSHAGEPSPEMGAAAGRQLTFTASLEGAEQSKAAHSAEAELAGLWQLRTSVMNSSTHEWEGLGKRSPLQRPPGNCSPVGLRPLNHGKCTNSHCKGSKKNDVRRGAGSRVLFQEGISASVALFPKLVPSPLLFPSPSDRSGAPADHIGQQKGPGEGWWRALATGAVQGTIPEQGTGCSEIPQAPPDPAGCSSTSTVRLSPLRSPAWGKAAGSQQQGRWLGRLPGHR